MDKMLSAQEVADYLGVPRKTIYTWNTQGTGPARTRIGKHIRYRRADVERWLQKHAVDEGPAQRERRTRGATPA